MVKFLIISLSFETAGYPNVIQICSGHTCFGLCDFGVRWILRSLCKENCSSTEPWLCPCCGSFSSKTNLGIRLRMQMFFLCTIDISRLYLANRTLIYAHGQNNTASNEIMKQEATCITLMFSWNIWLIQSCYLLNYWELFV